MTDYEAGWDDCRWYHGEDTTRNSEYKDGFTACLTAYHTAISKREGWTSVPRSAPPK